MVFKKGQKSWSAGKTKKDFPQLSNSGAKKGNIPWNKGLSKDADLRMQIMSKKVSKTLKRKFASGEIKTWMIGQTKESNAQVREQAEKHSVTNKYGRLTGNRNPFFGREHTVETKKIIGLKSTKNWENLEFVQRVMHRRNKSGPEIVFENMIIDNNLPYYFNGYMQNEAPLIIERKIPDFVHNTDKKLIEMWGEVFHRGQNPQDRIDFFKQFGYNTMIIWASELKNSKEVLFRVQNFSNEIIVEPEY